ncbi:DAK1 DegV-like protein [Coniophora puteana RWD-64-598 SS2]|uniref:DAK1 DegV-like protein n=1 Tax=Coniophora puteana (strain RWD-64-598) TaxID=741705 RepID=A0A5M3MF22_CONPW|nr:DAK1 DegV-like protein [Coniophora puteana RWD-64-598 SS2]EIW77520.1 DAK1 DegV-like protein [Coniophora puteana RWD-64-598 SS2]
MSSKHVFNSPEGLVLKALRGTVALNPNIRLHAPTKTVYVAHPKNSQVAVISGGGAGHEPAHAGYTGHGMLTSSVSGDIFASASAKQILASIEFAAFAGLPPGSRGRDVVAVINNYTGDRLNFGLAIEQARSLYPTIKITSVLNADDVSLLERPSLVGPRGLGGNIFVCKVLGAYAQYALNASVERAKALGDALVAHLRSIGAAMEHCHVPGRSLAESEVAIPNGEVEIGLGLHNEPGVKRTTLESSTLLVGEMVKRVTESGAGWSGAEIHKRAGSSGVTGGGPWIQRGDELVLFINNLGGISQLEMGAIVEEVREALANLQIIPVRIYVGPFMTSLNAPGFSISLANVTRIHDLVNTGSADRIDFLSLLDAPTDAHAWLGVRVWPETPNNPTETELEADSLLQSIRSASSSATISGASAAADAITAATQKKIDPLAGWTSVGLTPEQVAKGVVGACAAVLSVEEEMTRFDTVVGDGDCGETFAAGAKAVRSALDAGNINAELMGPDALVAAVGEILEGSMGGTIGALFAIFFTAWSNALRSPSSSSTSSLGAALTALGAHTPARPGDRTVVDAITPLCEALSNSNSLVSVEILATAAQAAKDGAEGTRGMKARLGRATYVGSEAQGSEGVPPDPGAWGVSAMASGFVGGMKM